MTSTFLSLLMVSLSASPLDQGAAVELRYSGTLSQVERAGSSMPVKRFSVYGLFQKLENDQQELAFLIDERGGGGWSWPEQYGLIKLNDQTKPTNKKKIQLLHNHDGTFYPLEVRSPLFEYFEKLEPGASWTKGKLAYEVEGLRQIDERDCWKIKISNNFGRVQTVWVDENSPLVVSAEQKIFMGRGDRFSLKMDLDSSQSIDKKRLAELQKPLSTLLKLQNDLGRPKNEQKSQLSEKQLNTANEVIAELERQADATPFSRLAALISRDVKSQMQRDDDVEKLAQKFVGKQAPELELESLSGEAIDPQNHSGKIVLLHFWNYQFDPLVEPYGQVGYLDYLNSRRKKLGVKVYGVGVNSDLGNPSKKQAALRSMKKLKDFMNLSYEIAVDDGSLLKKFGDPRKVDAELPLWVVIDSSGEIVHYKTGYYSIKPDEGLRQLDEMLIEQIQKQRKEEN